MGNKMGKKKKKVPFPTPEQILEYIENAPGKVKKRDIANTFYIRGDDRIKLKMIRKGILQLPAFPSLSPPLM